MRKKGIIVVLLLLAVVLMGQPSFAQEAGDFAIGVRASYNMYVDDSIMLFGGRWNTEYESVSGVSADFTYFFRKAFSLELGVGYVKTDMELTVPTEPWRHIGYGELTQIPVLLTARYHFAVSDKVMPYVGLGVGYYFNDMKDAEGSGDFFERAPAGVNSFADDAFGYHVVVGVEYFVTETIGLSLDLKYVELETDIGFYGAGYDQKGSTSLNPLVIGFGVKSYF